MLNVLFKYKNKKFFFVTKLIGKVQIKNLLMAIMAAIRSRIPLENVLKIIQEGTLTGGNTANTNVLAQISGTILEIPVREGDQVIESNNFNAGITIATVADMTKMIFEGQVDETEVAKLAEGSKIKVLLGALEKDEGRREN